MHIFHDWEYLRAGGQRFRHCKKCHDWQYYHSWGPGIDTLAGEWQEIIPPPAGVRFEAEEDYWERVARQADKAEREAQYELWHAVMERQR